MYEYDEYEYLFMGDGDKYEIYYTGSLMPATL